MVWLGSLALFALNAVLIRALFVTEYTRHMGSIEAAYMGISRWIIEHPFDFDWFPLWYGGIPFQNTYPPLLHMLVAGAAALTGLTPALAHHAVSAFFFCMCPVTLYWCAGAIGRNWTASFGAALLYSLVSPSLLLMPELRAFLGSIGRSVRLDALVEFGEGPHITALALLPLALLAVHWALEQGGVIRTFAAALAVAAVPLTNWIGAFALALIVAAYLLARAGEPGWWTRLVHALGIGAIAYALAAPWIPPSTLGDISRNAQHVEGNFTMTWGHLRYAIAIAAAVGALAWLLRRATLMERFIAYFVLFMSALVLTSAWFNIAIMPQPRRYHLEMEMALCLGVAFAASKLPTRARWAIAVTAVVLLAVQARNYWRDAAQLIQPIAIETTVEYHVAGVLRKMPPTRAYLSGSTQFWSTAFADIPQIGGGFDQGVTNPLIPAVDFGIPYTERDGERTAMWLRLFGAQVVFVTGPQSRDTYKQEWRDPHKFEGVLPELWREGDDVLYSVPARSASLAHVIRREHIVQRAPVNMEDVEPVTSLSMALEDPSLPLAEFTWTSPAKARVHADLASNQRLFVQVTHHPGWHATAHGREVPIERDALGFMLIDPQCSGSCEVNLRFDGGSEMQVAHALRWTAVGGGVLWWLVSRNRRNRR